MRLHAAAAIATFLPALALAQPQPVSLEIHSEFQRVDPFGNIVAIDRSASPREILSPAVARNAYASFHVVVSAPPGTNYFLYVVPNPLNACGVEMYKEHFTRTTGGWIPDALTQLHRLPDFGFIPDPLERVPGQTARAYLLDLWIPQDSPWDGFRLEVQLKIGTWIVRPMEIRILRARVPDLRPLPKGPVKPLSPIEARADAPAQEVLEAYIAGGEAPATEGPLNLRAIVRRNAIQDMALARSLDNGLAGPPVLKKMLDALAPDSGAEGYLHIRDLIHSRATGVKPRPLALGR